MSEVTGKLKKADYYYELPEELIAQVPLEDRAASRLLVLDKASGQVCHRTFRDITQYLRAGDCLVLNDTRVIPARLVGVRDTGAAVELLLLKRLPIKEVASQETGTNVSDEQQLLKRLPAKEISGLCYEALVRPGKKCRPGARLYFGGTDETAPLRATVVGNSEDGTRIVRFEYEGIFEEVLDRLGETPLPPYIKTKLADGSRYQTVYAVHDGSAAAPTAGLHFTRELLEQIESMGVKLAYVTLHVGLGTFRPVSEDVITDHHMHTEHYEVSEEAADTVNSVRAAGGRVICVGTTSVRTIESAARGGMLVPGGGDTDIFIYPGYEFKLTDGLVTNFHLPESTLIMLVSALAGTKQVLAAYEEAVRQHYRFFSFGDAMLII